MAFKIVSVPADESWGCLMCDMLAGRNVDAKVLFIEGEPGKRGVTKAGLCANHAEIIDHVMDDFREAQRRFAELEKE